MNTNKMEWKQDGNKMECCGKNFLTSQVFEMHKQVKHGGLSSKTVNPYLKMVTINETKLTPCHMCCEKFSSKLKLRQHLEAVHEIVTENKCPQCSFTAKNKMTLSWHLSEHHNNEKMICNFCGAKLRSKHSLNVHIKLVHTGVKMPCPKCAFSTRSAANLRRHFRLRHTDSGETCAFCGNVYKRVKWHQKVSMCGRDVDDREKFPCQSCGKVVVGKQSLRKHIEIVHERKKDRKCDQCSYATYSSFNLRLHVRKVHEGSDLNYEMCKFCDRTSSNMKLHVSTYHPLLLEQSF